MISRKKRRGVSANYALQTLIVKVFVQTVRDPDTLSVLQIIEKRRRDRINTCLMELRRLVPQAFEKQVRLWLVCTVSSCFLATSISPSY